MPAEFHSHPEMYGMNNLIAGGKQNVASQITGRICVVDLAEGIGKLSDLDDLERLAANLFQLSHCEMGQTASIPIRDILKYFTEVEAHIRLKVCPTGVCMMSGRRVKAI